MKKDEVFQYHLGLWSLGCKSPTRVSKKMTKAQFYDYYDEVISSGGKIVNIVKEKIK